MDKLFQEQLDEVAVRLRCYEPAGEEIELTERELMGHMLVTGGSGAGKSTRVIYPIIEQLVKRQRDDQNRRHSIVIFDTKADGEIRSLLERICLQSGREADLITIAPDEDSDCICLANCLGHDSLESIDTLAGLLSASIPRANENRYWELTFESLLRQALRLYALSEESVSYTDLTNFLIQYLLHAQMRDTAVNERLDLINQRYVKADSNLLSTIRQIHSAHQMWEVLDYRTKSILRSMATPLLDGLNSSPARGIFGTGAPRQLDEAIEAGKVVLISIDAIRYPELARLVGCVVKGQFYDAILSRTLDSKAGLRPAALILDDWLMAATGGVGDRYSDVSALSLMRSRLGYVVAGCQSLAALDLVMGADSRKAAFANFSNLVFFRGRDPELDAFAAAYLGQKSETFVDHSIPQLKHPSPRNQPVRYEREVRLPAVPVGSLARLPMGEAYAIIGNRIYDRPLCLVPTFAF